MINDDFEGNPVRGCALAVAAIVAVVAGALPVAKVCGWHALPWWAALAPAGAIGLLVIIAGVEK